jgi:hypothetical protein
MNANVENPKITFADFVSKSHCVKYKNAVTEGAFGIVCQLSMYQPSYFCIYFPRLDPNADFMCVCSPAELLSSSPSLSICFA